MIEKFITVCPVNFIDATKSLVVRGYNVAAITQGFLTGEFIIFRAVRGQPHGTSPMFEQFGAQGESFKSDVARSAVGSTHRISGITDEFSRNADFTGKELICLLYTSPSPRDRQKSRMPSSA